jgi:hypothetical protein
VACAEVLAAATSTNTDRSQMSRFFTGEKWTPSKDAAFDEALKRVARARVELAKLTRCETKRSPVVFGLDENTAG